jgi:acylaminoacyl-peptidase
VFVCWQHQSELAWPNFPQRLGVVHCYNRPCSLQAVPWPPREGAAAAATCLTPSLGSAFSPRFSPDGASLVFLSQHNAVASGVHNATATLHRLAWADAAPALAGGSLPPPTTGGCGLACRPGTPLTLRRFLAPR